MASPITGDRQTRSRRKPDILSYDDGPQEPVSPLADDQSVTNNTVDDDNNDKAIGTRVAKEFRREEDVFFGTVKSVSRDKNGVKKFFIKYDDGREERVAFHIFKNIRIQRIG